MNLSFSTRGWNNISWEEFVETATDMRFSGIEVYEPNKRGDFMSRGGPFHQYSVAAAARDLREKQLTIPCIDTSYDLSAGDACVEPLTELISLASSLQAPYVSARAMTDDEETVKENIRRLLPEAEKNGVTLLIETSGIYADTARLRLLLDSFARDVLASLWDVHHPYRDHNETADETIEHLGAYVRHVHLRDSDDKDT